MIYDNFIHVPFTTKNLDRYVVRCSIKKAIDSHLKDFKGTFLDAGCGKMPYREYIKNNSRIEEYVGLDIESAIIYDAAVKPDFTWDGKKMPFADHQFDTGMATEVLEHCPEPEVFLKEVYRVLRPDGVFFFTVPFLWNLHEVPHDEYRYTPFSLERHLKNAGFTEIEIKATGGWHAAMAQLLGLWVRRSPLSAKKRKILSLIIKPIVKFLLSKDLHYPVRFTEGQMITGMYGKAQKKQL
jgi:SAM-dependent methyltransferase